MRFSDIIDLAPLLDKGFTPGLFSEALKLNSIPIHIQWVAKEALDPACHHYANMQKWDPETTLVLYIEPPDEQSTTLEPSMGVLFPELGKLNHNQYLCTFFENTTLEELARKINQVTKMKAFL